MPTDRVGSAGGTDGGDRDEKAEQSSSVVVPDQKGFVEYMQLQPPCGPTS